MKYDYIITGMGLAGLQLAFQMSQDSFFDDKTILLIDKNDKKTNDRTWCFWEGEKGKWDSILHHQWQKGLFKSEVNSVTFPIHYKMIQGIDFYNYIIHQLCEKPQFTIINEKVLTIKEFDNRAIVNTKNQQFEATYCFDSIFHYEQYTKEQIPILQHFVGWFIETKDPVFDEQTVHFMDFSIPQKNNTRFMYVLPFSKNKALIEYTLFSGDVLSKENYENEIKSYLAKNQIINYTIIEKEQGVIPMTCFPLEKEGTKHIIKIGTAGGWTKASTGFTFKATEKKVEKLITQIKSNKINSSKLINKRHRLYDLLLLQILIDDNHKGGYIFSKLFDKNKPTQIFKFLDEDTNIFQELKIILKSPPTPFIKSIMSLLIG